MHSTGTATQLSHQLASLKGPGPLPYSEMFFQPCWISRSQRLVTQASPHIAAFLSQLPLPTHLPRDTEDPSNGCLVLSSSHWI